MMQELLGWIEGVPPTSPLAFALVALGGLVVGLAPSSLPLVPVVFGYVAGETRQGSKLRGFVLALGFVLGMATADAVLGALFGSLGFVVLQVHARYLALTNLAVAALLVILGLALLRKIRITVPVLNPALQKADSFGGAYALGIPFGFSTCPGCTPMVLPILGAAAATGSPWLGAALLFCFGLARGVPVLIAGTAAGLLKHLEGMSRWVPAIERGSGYLLLAAAAYFLYLSAVYGGWIPPFWALA